MTARADAFKTAYERYAVEAAWQLGLDPSVLLAQWALETGWGTGMPTNNLAGIRCGPRGALPFCTYATLEDFVAAYVATIRSGFYPGVLASAGQPVSAQVAALGASPWSGTHYGNPPGSNLIPYLQELAMATLDDLMNVVNIIHQGLFGQDPAVLLPPIQDRLKQVQDQVTAVKSELDAAKTEIDAISSTGVTVNLTQVNAKLDQINGKVDRLIAELHTP
jgi:hypothetical protein